MPKSDYFIFLLFLPAVLFAIAAFASNQPETKGKFIKWSLLFVCFLAFIIPIRFWHDFINWLSHHSN